MTHTNSDSEIAKYLLKNYSLSTGETNNLAFYIESLKHQWQLESLGKVKAVYMQQDYEGSDDQMIQDIIKVTEAGLTNPDTKEEKL